MKPAPWGRHAVAFGQGHTAVMSSWCILLLEAFISAAVLMGPRPVRGADYLPSGGSPHWRIRWVCRRTRDNAGPMVFFCPPMLHSILTCYVHPCSVPVADARHVCAWSAAACIVEAHPMNVNSPWHVCILSLVSCFILRQPLSPV
jgi:hypothetical protein